MAERGIHPSLAGRDYDGYRNQRASDEAVEGIWVGIVERGLVITSSLDYKPTGGALYPNSCAVEVGFIRSIDESQMERVFDARYVPE